MNKKILAGVVGVILLGASFYGGMLYQKSKGPTRGMFVNGQFTGAGSFGGRTAGAGGGRGAAGFSVGEILSKDATSFTIKMMDGSTKNVLVSDSTQVAKNVSGSLSDLTVGENVMVQGSSNSDGSITASTVSIRPQGFGSTATVRQN